MSSARRLLASPPVDPPAAPSPGWDLGRSESKPICAMAKECAESIAYRYRLCRYAIIVARRINRRTTAPASQRRSVRPSSTVEVDGAPVASRAGIALVHTRCPVPHTHTCLLSHTALDRKTKVTSVTCCTRAVPPDVCACARPRPTPHGGTFGICSCCEAASLYTAILHLHLKNAPPPSQYS